MFKYLICLVHTTNGQLEFRHTTIEFNTRGEAEAYLRTKSAREYTGAILTILEVYQA